jgi:hypothetical protein
MDTIFVKTLPNLPSKLHISLRTLIFEFKGDLDVEGSDEFGVVELPNVKVVAGHDIGEGCDVFFDVFDVKASRYGLEKDTGSRFAERDCRAEDDYCDDQRDARIGVEAPREVSQPDEESRCYDPNVS